MSRIIGDPTLIDAKLQTLEHRHKVARLSVFYGAIFVVLIMSSTIILVCEFVRRLSSVVKKYYFSNMSHYMVCVDGYFVEIFCLFIN